MRQTLLVFFLRGRPRARFLNYADLDLPRRATLSYKETLEPIAIPPPTALLTSCWAHAWGAWARREDTRLNPPAGDNARGLSVLIGTVAFCPIRFSVAGSLFISQSTGLDNWRQARRCDAAASAHGIRRQPPNQDETQLSDGSFDSAQLATGPSSGMVPHQNADMVGSSVTQLVFSCSILSCRSMHFCSRLLRARVLRENEARHQLSPRRPLAGLACSVHSQPRDPPTGGDSGVVAGIRLRAPSRCQLCGRSAFYGRRDAAYLSIAGEAGSRPRGP